MVNYSPIQIGESKEKFWRKLTDLADLETGHTPSRYHPEYWGGDIDWISISDITLETIYVEKTKEKITQLGVDNSSARFLPKGTVLLSRGPTIGKLCILPRPMTTNQSFVGWVPKSNLDTKYLYYLLLCSRPYFDSIGVGATMKTIYMKDVKNFYIYSPPLEEQKRIVAKIDTLFTKIDKAISLTGESLKQAKNLLPSVLKEVFEKGKADGWEEKKLQDICEKITDGTHQTPTYFEKGVVFLSSKNVTSGKINWDDVKYIDDAQHQKMHKRVSPRRKDILLAKNGTTGVAAMVDRDIVFDIYVSLAHIRSLGDMIPELLLYFINSPLAKNQFNKRLKGVGVPNLHLKEIREVLAVFPNNKEVQLELVQFLDKARNQSKQTQSKLKEQLAYLKQLKSSILSKAFKGEL